MNIHCQVCNVKLWEMKHKIDKKVINVCRTCWWHIEQKINSSEKDK